MNRLTSLILMVLLATPAIAFASSMVMIPEGPFTMGQGNQPPHGPERRLFLGPFLINQSEITHEEFQAQFPDHSFRKGAGQHPVTKMTWHQAKEYCEKIGGRPPTEPEWEKAAGGEPRLHLSLGRPQTQKTSASVLLRRRQKKCGVQ